MGSDSGIRVMIHRIRYISRSFARVMDIYARFARDAQSSYLLDFEIHGLVRGSDSTYLIDPVFLTISM